MSHTQHFSPYTTVCLWSLCTEKSIKRLPSLYSICPYQLKYQMILQLLGTYAIKGRESLNSTLLHKLTVTRCMGHTHDHIHFEFYKISVKVVACSYCWGTCFLLPGPLISIVLIKKLLFSYVNNVILKVFNFEKLNFSKSTVAYGTF